MTALDQIRTRGAATPQNRQADVRQVKNNAGGFTFTIPGEDRIRRFLTIGTEAGTFYVERRGLTAENGGVVLDWARNRPADLVRLAAEISAAGRAPRNDPAILAVMAAMALGDTEGRQAAERAFTEVVRTGTHLFAAAKFTEQFRGWGAIARRAFARWYLDKDADELAYQLVKYRQRHDWTHLDVLRSAHSTKDADQAHRDLFNWLAKGRTERDPLPSWVRAYERAREIERTAEKKARTVHYLQLIRDFPGLPWEVLPDEAHSNAEVLGALVDAGMPQTALIRQLPTLTRLGVLPPMSARLRAVCEQIADPARLIKARVHPLAVLIALRTYARGQSLRGSTRWVPEQMLCDALSEAFYGAFGAVEPSGQRTMLCTDISGSMGWPIYDPSDPRERKLLYPFTAAEIVGAMAMVTARFEPAWGIYGFATHLRPLAISPRMRLDEVMRVMFSAYGGGTNCSAPMTWALQNKVEVDVFTSYTDNETWWGGIHPHQALENYRQGMGIDASMQVVAVAANEFSIANPDDPRQLDVSGFDSAVPQLLADHARGTA